FYENEEKDVTRPAYRFYLDDEAVFYPASEFAQHVFTTDDTTSLHYQALVLFQELIRFHLQDSDPGPLVDADLYRLKFAHQHSVMPDKKERYLEALNTVADKYQEHPVGAIAAFEAASLQVGSEFRP